MEYIVSLSTQMKGFLLSLGFGVIIGILYDLMRIIRMLLTSRRVFVTVFDVLFAIAAALMSFMFFLTVTDGEIRLYILFGETAGFLIWYFTFGVIAVGFGEKTVIKFKDFLKRLFAFIFKPISKSFKRFCSKAAVFRNFLIKMSKKLTKNAKYHLKTDISLLYNQMDKMHECGKKPPVYESDKNYEHKKNREKR